MRIYTNKILGWPEILHLNTFTRLHVGSWPLVNIYKIRKNTYSFCIQTSSPIFPLYSNRKFYCYEYCTRNMSRELENISLDCMPFNRIYIPSVIENNDIIALYNEHNSNDFYVKLPLKLQ